MKILIAVACLSLSLFGDLLCRRWQKKFTKNFESRGTREIEVFIKSAAIQVCSVYMCGLACKQVDDEDDDDDDRRRSRVGMRKRWYLYDAIPIYSLHIKHVIILNVSSSTFFFSLSVFIQLNQVVFESTQTNNGSQQTDRFPSPSI